MNKITRKIIMTISAVALALGMVGAIGVSAEQAVPKVDHAVRWASSDKSVEAVLAEVVNKDSESNYRLIVISPKELQVAYHTSINSSQAVDIILKPVSGSTGNVKVYEFGHNFSRMTIWMSLTFAKDGKALNELTRTFYDGIDHPIANNPSR